MHNNKTQPPVAAPVVPDKTQPQALPQQRREAQPRELIAAVADIDRQTLWSTLRLRCALATK